MPKVKISTSGNNESIVEQPAFYDQRKKAHNKFKLGK